jgi:6-phosphogluconolactonase (cycloisomerase 2 family)
MGSINGSTVLTVTPPALVSIAVTPANPSILRGMPEQFTATGTYTDNSTANITTTATWSSSATSVATIGSTGTAATLATGSTTIQAAMGSVSGSTVLTVNPPALVSIAVTPASFTIGTGTEAQYTAIGTYSDATVQNLTGAATWNTTNNTVATISNTAGSNGVAMAAAVGSVTITASLNGITGANATLNVTTPPGSGKTAGFAYVTSGTYGYVGGYGFQAATGALNAVANSPFVESGYAGLSALADPSGKFLYVANPGSNTVSAFTIDAMIGALTPVPGSPFATSCPDGVAVDPMVRYLYVTNCSNTVSVFTIDAPTGALTPVPGSPFAAGNSPAGVAVDMTGEYLYVANANSSNISAYSINASTGALTPVAGSPFATGNCPYGVAADPIGEYVYVTNECTATVSAYSVDGTSGVLTQVTGSPFATVSNPISAAIDPMGKYLYVGSGSSDAISVYSIAGTSGVLTQLSGSPFATLGQPYGIAVHPSGNFVYTTSGNADPGGVSGFVVDVSTGALSPAAESPFQDGFLTTYQPYAVVIAPSAVSSSATLVSLQVTPPNPTFTSNTLGQSHQFTAMGTYSDGSTAFLTDSVNWSTSNGTVMNISGNTGQASTQGYGTATIMATLGTVSGTSTVTVSPAALVSIAVTPANPSVAKGTPQQFTATGTYTDNSTANITTTATWTSSATSVATISSAGTAATVATGSTTIQVAVGSINGSTVLTVTPQALVSIAVTPANPSVAKGTPQQFTATGTYSDNSTANITTTATWSSSATSVATISSTGAAATLTAGSTTIQAAVGSINGSTVLTVTPPALVSIAVTPANPSIAKGTPQQFTATGTYSDNSTANITSTATWSSSATSVATISSAGTAATLATGSTTIQAAVGSVNGSTVLTVNPPALVSIAVTPSNPSVAKGTPQQFTATGTYSDNSTANITSTATWSSSATSVATIGSTGAAATLATGSTTIQAVVGSISGSTVLTVMPPALVSIAVTPANPSVTKGTPQQFTAAATYSDNSTANITSTATWSSSATSVATISSTGAAATLATGSTTIKAVVGSINGSTVLTVTPPALVSIAVTPANPSVAKGTPQQFTATGTYTDNSTANLTSTATWSSSATSVATISSTGAAATLATGSTTIQAAVGSIKGSTVLTVTAPALVSIAVTPATPSVAEGTPQQFTATGTYTDNSTANLTSTATWSSSATSVATISSTGAAATLATGSTTIQAAVGSIKGSTVLTVTCPCTIWSSSAAPKVADSGAGPAVEIGVKFTSSSNGQITGIRFYKSSANTGTHVGNLWSSTGTLLAKATFSNETASGWQQVNFSTPVTITANTVYVASYHTTVGHFSADQEFFATTGVSNPPLEALANGVNGGDGVYTYGSTSSFPSTTYNSTNYWVDLVFALAPQVPLTSIAVTPTNDPTVNIGGTQQFTATGTYQDNSTQNITTQVTWSSSSTAVATINSAGLATGQAAGSSTISASLSGITSPGENLTVAAPACPCTIWSSSAVPKVADSGAGPAVEIGVKFTSSSNGQITGIRFYKSSANTGTHVGNLWSSTGTLLAKATFSNETASGWQQVNFSTPVTITANTVYVASYHTTVGHFSADQEFFATTGVSNPPLEALANGVNGGDGVYTYGSTSSFPSTTYNSTNYWVDLVFQVQ